MNATNLGLWLHLRSAFRPKTPAAPRPAAGTDPGEAVESATPARPVTGLDDHTVTHILGLVCEYGGLIRQEMQFTHLAGANKYDPNLRNADHARDLQATYYAEIRAHLNGARP